MRKISYIIVIILTVMQVQAQNDNFSIGLVYQPFLYQHYNKQDWNGSFIKPVNPRNFNGNAFGIVFSKPLNNYFSVKSELTFCSQEQTYSATNFFKKEDDTTPIYSFNVDIYSKFKIIKIPIISSIRYNIGYDSGFYVNFGVGGQISYLVDFESVEKDWNPWKKDVNNQPILSILRIDQPKSTVEYIWDGVSNDPPKYETRMIYEHQEDRSWDTYNIWLFGLIGELSLSRVIFSNLVFTLGYRFEYDFTNSEKFQNSTAMILFRQNNDEPRPKSHNIRNMLNFSVMYNFEKFR